LDVQVAMVDKVCRQAMVEVDRALKMLFKMMEELPNYKDWGIQRRLLSAQVPIRLLA
jgi:hypothetical protein